MLRNHRHPNLDFFVADFTSWSTKDDHASMEHPFFSLTKHKFTDVALYVHREVTLTVSPNAAYGMPTIWDKDILIYCCSQLIEGMKQGREPKQEVAFGAYDFLVSTNRSTSDKAYRLIVNALNRLAGVLITTNIPTGGSVKDRGFHLIEEYDAEFSFKENGIRHILVKLPDWLYDAVLNLEVLTLSKDYFRLDGGLERRIYELCRKHCGNQPSWSVSLDLLRKKSGSRAPLRNFRLAIRKLVGANYLPDYRLHFEADKLTVYANTREGGFQEFRDRVG